MLISKFDLYKPEWLELVFDDRNKTYGAYELRQHNGRTMVTAMEIAFAIVGIPLLIVGVLVKTVAPHTVIHDPFVVVPFTVVHPAVVTPPRSTSHVHTPHVNPAVVLPTHPFAPLVVSDKPTPVEPPKVTDLPADLGPTQVNASGTGTGINDGKSGPGSPGIPAGTSNDPVLPIGLERMPEPYGGASAWAKFLQKHLKYPDMAVDAHMQGKIFVSFIVEKDGHLSNFTIDRGMGYGLDEEALRVLKLAPAWKPGIQNGQPVRVKYNIPINFKLGEDGD